MHFSLACIFAFSATLTAAAPLGHKNTIRLRHDEVLLYGEGGLGRVMKRSEYEEYKAAHPIPPSPPTDESISRLVGGKLIPGRGDAANASLLEKRDNLETIYMLPDMGKYTKSVEWDLLLSNVVVPGDQNNGRITATYGRSVSNSISTGGGIDLGKIQKLLSFSLNVDYTRTHTSEASTAVMLEVNKGMYSILVANPYKYTRVGYVWRGNVGESERGAGTIAQFTTAEYKTGASGPLNWVMGEIGIAAAYTNDIPCRVGNCKALDRVDVGTTNGQAKIR